MWNRHKMGTNSWCFHAFDRILCCKFQLSAGIFCWSDSFVVWQGNGFVLWYYGACHSSFCTILFFLTDCFIGWWKCHSLGNLTYLSNSNWISFVEFHSNLTECSSHGFTSVKWNLSERQYDLHFLFDRNLKFLSTNLIDSLFLLAGFCSQLHVLQSTNIM